MNDRFDIVEGDVVDSSTAASRRSRRAITAPHDRVDRRARRLRAARASSRRTFICVRRSSAAYADDLAADGLAAAARRGRWKPRTRRRRCAPRRDWRRPSCCASGTTSVLTMETVHDTDVVFEAVAESGLRATIGKCMMDFDAQVPARLQETHAGSRSTRASRIRTRWHGAGQRPACARRSRRASPCRARASCSRRWRSLVRRSTARSCTRTRPSRATRSRSSRRCRAA